MYCVSQVTIGSKPYVLKLHLMFDFFTEIDLIFFYIFQIPGKNLVKLMGHQNLNAFSQRLWQHSVFGCNCCVSLPMHTHVTPGIKTHYKARFRVISSKIFRLNLIPIPLFFNNHDSHICLLVHTLQFNTYSQVSITVSVFLKFKETST